MDQYIQFDSEVRFPGQFLFYFSVFEEQFWTELCYCYTDVKWGCIVRQTLILRETGRMVGKLSFQMWFQIVFSQGINWRHSNHFPIGNFVFFCFQKGQNQTHIQKGFLSGKQIQAVSPPLVFLLTFVFQTKLSHVHFTLHICKICAWKSSFYCPIIFWSYFSNILYAWGHVSPSTTRNRGGQKATEELQTKSCYWELRSHLLCQCDRLDFMPASYITSKLLKPLKDFCRV